MSDIDWDDLARKAEAATPGPWEADPTRDGGAVITARSEHGRIWIASTAIPDNPVVDAEYIAAASPATILRLIEDNRNLRDELSNAHADVVREAMETAWREGYDAATGDLLSEGGRELGNPYQKEESGGDDRNVRQGCQ